MAITTQQLSDLRQDFGDTKEDVFTDPELSRIWERVAGAATTTVRHEAALALMYRQLLSQANKFHDYTAGSTSEKLSQVRKHIKDSYDMYKSSLDAAMSRQKQMSRTTLRGRKHQERNFPDDHISNVSD